MRVLHVIPDLNPEAGGPSRSIPELCSALVESGTKVTLFSTCIPGKQMTIDPARVPYEVILFRSAAGLSAAAWKLSRQIANKSALFDIAHIHSLWNPVATLAAVGARRGRLPYVLSPRGMLDQICLNRRRPLKRFYSALLERRTVERASLLHFLNDNEAESLRVGWFRFPGHFIAPNGIGPVPEPPERGLLRRRFPELADRQLMLFLGRLHPIKGLDLQLEALAKLVGSHPRLLWVLIGPDDGEWRRLEKQVHLRGLDDHVRWLGPMLGQERLAALADADVFVQTSLYECYSMTVGEAMAVGTPLVITDTVNRPEVEAVGAGLVVSRTSEALAWAIEEVLSSPARMELMRAAGRRYARQNMAWSQIARDVNAAYSAVLNRTSSIGRETDAGNRAEEVMVV